jgi:hypothetical protein
LARWKKLFLFNGENRRLTTLANFYSSESANISGLQAKIFGFAFFSIAHRPNARAAARKFIPQFSIVEKENHRPSETLNAPAAPAAASD